MHDVPTAMPCLLACAIPDSVVHVVQLGKFAHLAPVQLSALANHCCPTTTADRLSDSILRPTRNASTVVVSPLFQGCLFCVLPHVASRSFRCIIEIVVWADDTSHVRPSSNSRGVPVKFGCAGAHWIRLRCPRAGSMSKKRRTDAGLPVWWRCCHAIRALSCTSTGFRV